MAGGRIFFSAALSAAEIKSPLPHITTGTLPNGLHYTLVPLEGQKQRVDIRLAVDAGSVDESEAQSGVAHMVEHMVFRASEAYPSGVANMLHQKGWIRAQHYNAMTNYERTQYMMSPPAGKRDLPLALAALSQMVGHASLLQSDLDDERKIILEEWRGKLGVAERMNQQRVQAIRQGSRYPDRPVIGTQETINTMPATQLQDFYQRWYHPSNMRLMVIGDIVPQEVVSEIAHQFGSLPAVSLPARHYYEPRLQQQLNVVRLQDSESGASQIAFVFRLNDPQNKKIGLEGMRHRLLDQLATNALQRQLRRQSEHLPDSVNSLVMRKSDIGKTTVAVGFFADVIPGEHQAALPVLLQEIERVKRYPLSERDIVELKNDIRQAANRMADNVESREFADWVQQLSVGWLQSKPYVSAQQIGRDALTLLPSITPHRALAGTRESTVALNIELRSEVRAWSYTEQPWTPQAAVQVSVARNLANKYLKNSLRDEALGIYRMRLDSELADKAQRIETEISFTASPERGHELWQRAEQVLANLPQRITADDVEQQRQQFIRAEQGRNNDFTTQQRRLILSDRHYGDPRYLSDVANLAQAVTLEEVRAMAAKLLNLDNRVLLLSLPREEAETAGSVVDSTLQGDAAL
ncbi:M16 family metallopeptidase [Symbiopectobacterium sp.]|uniref:M16 family metallopeptidase n=1 Tax=Symbiopectobacterium sp. TaxID=2952789 RepID=UPI003F3627E4